MPAALPSCHATADLTAPGGARAVARCDALGVEPYSDTATGLFHGWLGPANRATVEQVGAWMEAAGMQVCIDPRQLVSSGAGHDAMVMAALCPTAMLCVHCAAGISHHPDEHVDPADAELALAVMRHFIEHLGDPLVT
ncbi:hypothetical protein ADT26_11525 [Xanthomonas oryzae]|nr:M20/M25/M40 family metallo-hydrolase [Xanthomonas oryzae]AVU01418.1 hypothetical protein C0L90_01115 [Xanthomonas oryzae pv. oryzae]KOR43589.1 hypothetical protein ADT26_11525 [Xanthomonas oryzae]QBI14635.1 M20/M25/M40 family metallo-hydrolase [Xanthomonas oryzae pv. oryzae]QBN26897.1 M20/M25/M40 family metallo-hydrolase [Xanthomonas oryzae pv. oryzae]QBN37914.1 M20/M25/M40 family metallo-hydrolase [Xanthomonas oryzae pv. oryzae]